MSDTIHNLKIELKNLKPMIGREVLVASDIRLDRLHQVIQVAMGWADSHMHEYIVGTLRGGERFGMPVSDPFASGPRARNETKFTLRQIAPDKGSKLLYWYDFGDDWNHEVSVKAVLVATPDQPVPYCLDASRACPPEDCGGPGGYANLLRILGDPKHEEHDDMRDWIGDGFDPGYVNVDAINKELAALARRWSRVPRKRAAASR